MSDNYMFANDDPLESLRIPPHSIPAEQAVLGGLMLDNQTWDSVADKVQEVDFYRRDHRLIFRVIAQLAEKQSPFDIITISEALAGELEDTGGLAYLGWLAKNTPSAANIVTYANIVRDRSVLRQLIHVGTTIADSAFNPEGRETAELLESAEREVFKIAEQRQRGQGGFIPIKALLAKAVDRIETLFEQDGNITGAATGFSDFDQLTSGLQPADLIIVAGRPSMGKTTIAMNMAENIAIKSDKAVAVFSMEMPGDALAMRMMSSLGRIDQHKVRTGKLEDDEWPRLTSAINLLAETKLFIDDTPALSPTEVRSRARRLTREHGQLGLIVLDYLQLMQSPSSGENRVQQISDISRGLKALAKELNVPVIALSQLNRNLEQRPNKRPVMSDLRECVTGDTLVLLADGRRLPISELVGQTPEVVSVSPQGQLQTAATDLVWSVGRKEIVKVSLASGRTIRCTKEHRLRGLWDWQRAGQLQPGDKLQALANNALFWDRVVAVEPAGEEEVFDLTVPGNACWLADGIVSHNSGAIEQDADLIVFVYRDEVYNEDSPDKGIAEIIIGKQRNGPLGTVRLTFLGQYTRFENFSGQSYSAEDYE
ncbi:replicative DNA helicase [Methylovulum psychrotolerans]|uniref:Replicative DNA helicase n=1 Tax=Methylovulum psychrotolerans TaxID=1704499 RepID=A0A1Z4BX12_9GAMM|nr:replicative DNA helicase [Methylovulum psychrotolerans]ASF45802.1 replicative DNA helicase [Methylovulum psychrotolerans]